MITFVHTLHSKKSNRPFLLDVSYLDDAVKKPVVVFVHGFKGFKDWGPFPLMASYFAEQGMVFLKFNLSHNGTTPENPTDFTDLEAFGNDNFTTQLEDLAVVLDFVGNECGKLLQNNIDTEKIYLLGHSRGGSLVLLKAAEDSRVKKVVAWSAVSDLLAVYKTEDIKNWKESGVRWIGNARTRQQMPIYYQFYEDLIQHKNRLEVLKAVTKISQPLLILHGDKDETVSVQDAYDIHGSAVGSELQIIENANHTFGGTHPYTDQVLPVKLREVCDQAIKFFCSGN